MNHAEIEKSRSSASSVLDKASSIAATSLRYIQTVRHLRPVQIYGRGWHRLHVPRPDLRPAPTLRDAGGVWCDVALRNPSMLGPTQFKFLNHIGQVIAADDWNTHEQAKLWLYNLHYFDDLNAANRRDRRDWHAALITRWITDNPPGHGNGWEPYPLSLRIVNWVKWTLAGNLLEVHWIQSLAVQTRYLRARLEWHLLGNHLLANAKALIFAGIFFSGPEADEWLSVGLRILDHELKEQILSDGAHFELSPMYHAIIQEDLLDIVNLARAYPVTIPAARKYAWEQLLSHMRAWLVGMTHPDEEIAFFNDAAIGIAASPPDLERYALRLGLSPCNDRDQAVTYHSASGYIRVHLGPFTAFLDTAKIGPNYLPGHAHADTLSFELSLGQARIMVNRGTSLYGDGLDRLEQRSTAAHNTVEVDMKNSSDVWGGFRVGARARPFDLEIEESPDLVRVACSHDGYHRFGRRVTHRREWLFSTHRITITDRLLGKFTCATSRVHFAPSVSIDTTSQTLISADKRLKYSVKGANAAVATDTYHPRFGLSVPTQCLELRDLAPVSEVRFSLTAA